MSNFKAAWVSKSSTLEKPWGNETAWSGGYAGNVKTLTLDKGKRTSFKINKTKDEMLICGAGKVRAYFGNEELATLGVGDIEIKDLTRGMALIVQSGCPYRIEALDDAVILEVSSNLSADVIRLHDDYGRPTEFINNALKNIIDKMWSK
jgi:mannose-6-phosphate isomerase-like protein (cupin superfamily)